MNIEKIASPAGILASVLCLAACTSAVDDGSTDSQDQVGIDGRQAEETGTASQAVAESPDPCSWAEMDQAQSACDNAHGWFGRTYLGCTLTSCVATSTTIYYTYTVGS
jgi:hypothetical protein